MADRTPWVPLAAAGSARFLTASEGSGRDDGVHYRLSNTLEGSISLAMLDEALSQGRPEVLNTDQGVRFTAEAFTRRLESAGVAVSMDGRGRAIGNVLVERLRRAVKYVDVYIQGYEEVPGLRRGLARYFDSYNHAPLH